MVGSLDSHCYIGNIVILKFVISGFCPIHFTLTFSGTEYSSLYQEYCNIEDCYIGVLLYMVNWQLPRTTSSHVRSFSPHTCWLVDKGWVTLVRLTQDDAHQCHAR